MTQQESLIIASKVKNMIREKSGMNSASNIVDALSALVEARCNEAIERAKKDRRKTVMARDFEA